MFNAFKYTKQLEEAGFSRLQAEMQLQIITEIVEGELATKQDLKITETGVRQELKSVETSLRQDLKTVDSSLRQELKTVESSLRQDLKILETNLENKIQQVEYRIIIKLGTLLIVGFTTMATLMKFWLIR